MKKSFTLIEMLVTISIVSIIGEAVLIFFFSSISSQGKIISVYTTLSELNYVFEYMSRQLRMAKKDDILFGSRAVNCLTGTNTNYEISDEKIIFRDFENNCHEFFLDNKAIKESINGSSFPITSKNLVINKLQFHISGETQEDLLQPRVTILIEASAKGKFPFSIKVQTTVSQRDLDVSE